VRRRRLPQSVRGGEPPAGGRSSIASTRGGGGYSIRSSGGGSQVGGGGSPIQRVSDSGALVRASGSVPEAPRRRHFQGRRASGARRRASSDGDAWGARFERGASRKARDARSDDRAWHLPIRRSLGGPSDDLHLCLCHRRRPPATTSFDSCFLFDYCVLCLPDVLFMLKTVRIYAWTRSSYISLLHAHWKDNSLIYDVRNLRACNGNSHDFAVIFASI
jgi:hypothetical protein